MTPWVGQRVQMVGTVVPAKALGAQAAAPAAAALQEFRVQSVMPVAGSCTQ
jgi:hypothetical protein